MVSFRNSRKICSYLVRPKLYPVERSVGSFISKRPHCQICTNVNETDIFACTVTGETYKINHQFVCMEKCLIKLLSCNKCRKQYVGQTFDTVRYRWNNYKSTLVDMCLAYHACKNTCTNIFVIVNIAIFLKTSQ